MGGFLELPGQRIFYEEHGAGEPLFLLHGGFAGAESWLAQIAAFAEEYHVFVPERRGHGRSPDVAGPYTTEVMAAETAAVIQALTTGPVHVVGWSDGAYVAAHLALHRPELVRSAVLIGQALARAGETEGVRALMHDLQPSDVIGDKIITLWREPLEMPIPELAQITAPVLVMQGDDDGVRIDWNLELARALPRGQFAVIPGTGHGAPQQKPAVVNRLILDFLREPDQERMLPMGALHDRPAA